MGVGRRASTSRWREVAASSMRPHASTLLRNLVGAFATALILHVPAPLSAQSVEVAPLGGYRFGGDLFEVVTNRPVDLDVTPVVGGTVNVDIGEGLWFA